MSSITGRPSLTVIVQNALVLSADRQLSSNVDPAAPVPGNHNLVVSTFKDSSKIQLASSNGSISLSLRGDRDNNGKGQGDTSLNLIYFLNPVAAVELTTIACRAL